MKNRIVVLVCLPMFCMAQTNLVLNGDFESHATLQANDCAIEDATPWFDTGFSVDYFNANRPPLVFPPDTIPHCEVPENTRGYQNARSGIGYGGFHAFSRYQANGREFIQTELSQPLSIGVRYEVSFFVSLADDYKYAIKTIGAYFSQHPIFRTHYEIDDLNITPQMVNISMLLDDKENWMEIRDTLLGRTGIEGGERYLIIGNFNLDETSDTVMLESGLGNHSYYYIDDVSVIALDSVPDGVAEMETIHLSVYPNPSSQFVQIHTRSFMYRLRLLDIRGREVMVREVAGRKHTLELGDIPSGMYFLEVTDNEGRMATERIIKTDGP
jgi:hypothetical protein